MKQYSRAAVLAAALIVIVGMLSGCGPSGQQNDGAIEAKPANVPLTNITATHDRPPIPVPSAPGIAVEQNENAIIDYSNAGDGYVMAKFHLPTTQEVKIIIETQGGVEYVYNLDPGEYGVFPLTEGDGLYEVGVYEQMEGMRFKLIVKAHVDVAMPDPLSPFLRPSQFVNYNKDSEVVKIAARITGGSDNLIDIIADVYHFIIENIEYDMELAQTVQSGYIPDLDSVLKNGKGICFDYAALMSAMLRSQGVPTKMVFGYTGDSYHAWINVYSEETGWIDNVIFFDGHDWSLMDPTFAAGSNSAEVARYIGDGTNYEAKFQY